MLGISERQLEQWVLSGKVHRPYRIEGRIALYDASALADDWDQMKSKAFEVDPPARKKKRQKAEPNPWDVVLK
jgi:hypothetical protein